MLPDSPYAQYWLMQPTPEQAKENALQWAALVSMRAAVQGGSYASDLATAAIQRRWEWLRWMVETRRITEYA